jgi:hypothetical protein
VNKRLPSPKDDSANTSVARAVAASMCNCVLIPSSAAR